METDPYYLIKVPEITIQEECNKLEMVADLQNASPASKQPGANNTRSYHCTICFKTFTRNEHVHRHMLTHTGIKPFKCLICGKDFSRNEHLQRHSLIHTGYRPYSCSACGKKFGRSEHLRRHEATHFGETLLNNEVTIRTVFQCQKCNRKFNRNDNLRKHQQKHCHFDENESVIKQE